MNSSRYLHGIVSGDDLDDSFHLPILRLTQRRRTARNHDPGLGTFPMHTPNETPSVCVGLIGDGAASSRAFVVLAPRASISWRMRSVSYWLALQPNVW
jgi:hypothetical protein